MIITIASYKGGVGKTTTAIHLAAYFQRFAPTLLIDGDIIRASTKWSQRGDGKGFPFKVVDESQTAKYAREYVHGHIIIDTEANPSTVDFRQVADGCDLLVIPAVPETTESNRPRRLDSVARCPSRQHATKGDASIRAPLLIVLFPQIRVTFAGRVPLDVAREAAARSSSAK